MTKEFEHPSSGEAFVTSISLLSQKIVSLYSQAVQNQTGLNWREWRILSAVMTLQSCRAQDICKECQIKKSHVSNTLTRLEKEGHISRLDDEHDGRSKLVVLTPKGAELIEEAKPALEEFSKKMSFEGEENGPAELLNSLHRYQEELGRMVRDK